MNRIEERLEELEDKVRELEKKQNLITIVESGLHKSLKNLTEGWAKSVKGGQQQRDILLDKIGKLAELIQPVINDLNLRKEREGLVNKNKSKKVH